MNYLRRISTRRLLTLCALTLVVAIGATAVAVATSGDGPKPEPKPLANAVHDALDAPELPGISAEVEFTNNLIDASSLEGGAPLLTGATGRLWASPADGGKLRLELQASPELGGGSDSQILVDGERFEIYDGTTNTVYRGTIPEEKGRHADAEHGIPSVARIQKEIDRAGKHADISGAEPTSVAGQPTYTVSAAPSHDGGLLGAVELAWDADNGVPLRAAVYASDSGSPVLELEATEVSFEAVDASIFASWAPPEDAKVVELTPEAHDESGKPREIAGVDAVTAALDFPLTAPKSLAGLPRTAVRAIEVDGKQAALVTYGEGLGGIAVIQSATEPAQGQEAAAEGELSLPEVVIGDVKGEELDTALGSALWFSRDGVDYVVVGSVPPAAVEAAARGL